MSVVDRERFLQCVTKSEVLEKEALDGWLSEIDADTGVKDLARDLIRKNLTTKWQGKMLAKGASRLKLGNYLLTDRVVEEGEAKFGDRFAAVHRQLSRNVVIQYLPADVCGAKELKNRLFAIGSKLADLDHPNLVHVYDVDEERNRIYLVSETCDGKSLEDYLADQATVSCKFVAQIVSGCLKGLSYAHAKGVVHSGVSATTVAIKPDGDAQVTGLIQFAVQNAIADAPVDVDDDLAAVESIGNRLLGLVDEEERDGESFSTLASAIGLIRSDSTATVATLDELASKDSLKELSVDDMVLASEAERTAASGHPETAVAPSGSATSSAVGVSGGNNTIPFEAASEGFLTSLARRNPVALIGASALSALLLIGGTVFAASQLTSSPIQTAEADKSDSKTFAKSQQKDVPSPKVDRSSFRQKKGALSSSVGETVLRDSVTNPDTNRAAIDAIFNKPNKKEASDPIEVVTKSAAEPEESPVVPVVVDNAQPNSSSQSESEVAVVTSPAAAEVQNVEIIQKTQTQVSGSTEEFLAAGTDPFEKFATTVDLPDVASTEQGSFGKLLLEKKHLLGVELLSSPLIHRSKPIFVMTRSADDRQAWDIGYKKKKKSDPVMIAKLQKTPNELRFNWLPEATEITAANFLRNCRVKLSTATHSHWLSLRKPLRIEGFKLGKDQGSVKLEVDIPHLPNPIAIAATLSGLKFERLNTSNYRERAYLVPAEITPTAPARMYFHEDADRFLSLDVLADVRKKLTLGAALVIQPSPEQPAMVLEDPRTIPQVAQNIRNMAMLAQQKSSQAQASKLKKDQKDAFKRAAKKATDQAELTQYYEHVVPQLVDKDIPVTITYALNDQHRIVLAYTVESDEKKKSSSAE